MSSRSNSVQNGPAASDERLRDALRIEIGRAVNVERRYTRAELAEKSGVNIHNIDQITSQDVSKHRRVALEDALSIGWVLGQRSINAILGVIGYAARPLEEANEMQPMMIAATAMGHLSTIATAAADGRFDHTEQPACQQAADMLIATVLPLSSAGKAS